MEPADRENSSINYHFSVFMCTLVLILMIVFFTSAIVKRMTVSELPDNPVEHFGKWDLEDFPPLPQHLIGDK